MRRNADQLHFHGLLYIPEGKMSGELIEKKDYNTTTHRMQKTIQNTFFNKKFGRSDFEEIYKNLLRAGNALGYIMKYIKKTGEKIIRSRGLPMYLVLDGIDEDVITRAGEEDKKLLLADDFQCWKEGELIGQIGEETKRRMKTSN